MAALVKITQPAVEPVTLDVTKRFLRVSTSADDALISLMITAARESAEVFTNRAFITTRFRQSLDSFPYFVDTVMSQMAYPPSYYSLPRFSTTLWNYSQMIKLFRPPLQKVERIQFLASSDQQWHDNTPIPNMWRPGTVYATNDLVADKFANIQKCITPGTSDANPPTWGPNVGDVTTERQPDPQAEGTGVQWQNVKPVPAPDPSLNAGTAQTEFGTFIQDADSEPARIFPGPPGGFWPPVLYVPNAVQIYYLAGYGDDGSKVPGDIKMAILQTVAHWYENHEVVMPGTWNELPHHCKMLLWGKRVEDFQPTRG